MAKMFPEWISESQRKTNPKFRAEFKVYDALTHCLPENWYVFYSRTWSWVEDSSRVRVREADFIIAHPQYGILIMEIKGGQISVENGQWISTDKYGDRWEINPYNQVAIATRSLERRLSDEERNPFKGYRFSTAVCFPDVDISSILSNFELQHQRITIDAPKMENLYKVIIDILKDEHGNFAPPGEARILVLKELVASSWYVNLPKSIQIGDTENEIKRLTDKQFKLLYQLAPTAHRLLVTGCAGAGKTMLGAETARRMASLGKKKVLFTCFNRNLALWVRESPFFVDNGLMLVSNYHKLCASFILNSGRKLPSFLLDENHDLDDPIFNENYTNIFLEVVTEIGEQFDAIIIDEGQDFLDAWWTPLLLLLKDTGYLHVYYDTRQQLWGIPRNLPKEITDNAVSIDLTENVRNTKPIHNLAMKFHLSRGRGYKALSKGGIDPEFIPICDNETERQVVQRVVEQLVSTENVPTFDIAILTPLSLKEGNSLWKPGKTLLGSYLLVHHLHPDTSQIFCSSIRSAKGLEFPVVIITELWSSGISNKTVDYYSAQLYVGISRARSHLIIISDKKIFDEFIGRIQ